MSDKSLNTPYLPDHLIEIFRNLALNERPLEALPALAASLVDYLPVCVYTCFFDGHKLTISSISGGVTRLLGYSKEELRGKKSFRDLSLDDTPYQRIPTRHTRPHKEFACMQMYYTADRGIKLLIDRGYFFYSRDGRLLGTAGMLVDFGLAPGLEIYDYLGPKADEDSPAEADRTANLCGNIASQSIIMKSVFERIIKLATSSASVVIHGESGTGKELVARAIHDLSPRRHKAFVAVNCGAIPENLIESALFGHRKGAFTGADHDRQGFLDEADQGTLFLDEVGEMPLAMQTKLLRVLDGYGYSPVGSNKVYYSDFRVLCATHRNLEELLSIGLMRADFYYRLKAVDIRLPPLRERREDIPVLVDFFVAKYYEKHRGDSSEPKAIVPQDVKDKFMTYDWPGNVRELRQAVVSYLSLKELSLPDQPAARPPRPAESPPPGAERPKDRDDYTRAKLLQTMEAHDWNIDEAARALDISKRTLYRRLSKYNLK